MKATCFIPVPIEVLVLLRENRNSWYSINTYYLANYLAELPFLVSEVLVNRSCWERKIKGKLKGTEINLSASSRGYSAMGKKEDIENGKQIEIGLLK